MTGVQTCALPISTSLPEVVSGKYLLVKPKDINDIAKAVENVKNNKFSKSKLKKFELKENIKNYIKVYKGILNEN